MVPAFLALLSPDLLALCHSMQQMRRMTVVGIGLQCYRSGTSIAQSARAVLRHRSCRHLVLYRCIRLHTRNSTSRLSLSICHKSSPGQLIRRCWRWRFLSGKACWLERIERVRGPCKTCQCSSCAVEADGGLPSRQLGKDN